MPRDDAMRPKTIMPVPVRYLTSAEAASLLRLSPRTLEKHRVLGGAPGFTSSAAASYTR